MFDGTRNSPFILTSRKEQSASIYEMLRWLNWSADYRLFGLKHTSLVKGAVYAGSIYYFMNPKITDEELQSVDKLTFGDADILCDKNNKSLLETLLVSGKIYGDYIVKGVSKHGNEISAIMRHMDTESNYQFDFIFVDFNGYFPTTFNRFARLGASMKDMALGLKRIHSKVLLSALTSKNGEDKKKYVMGISGLRKVTDKAYITDLYTIFNTLFDAKPTRQGVIKMMSFSGLISLISAHLSQSQQQTVMDKYFKSINELGSFDGKDVMHSIRILQQGLKLNDKTELQGVPNRTRKARE